MSRATRSSPPTDSCSVMTPPCKSKDFTARVVPDEHPFTLVTSSGRCPGGLGREQVEGLGQDLVGGDVGDQRGMVGRPAVLVEAVGAADRAVQPPGGRGPVPCPVQRPVAAETDTPVDGDGGRADRGGQVAWSRVVADQQRGLVKQPGQAAEPYPAGEVGGI